MDANKKTAYLFVDGSNLHWDWVNEGMGPMDVEKFIDEVRRLFNDYNIARIYYYCTATSKQMEDTYLRRLSYIPYVEVIPGTTKEKVFSSNGKSFSTTVDCGTDVNIAVNMFYHSIKGHCDAVILVSRDADFCGAVNAVKREGVTVELCALEPHRWHMPHITSAADNVRFIPVEHFKSLLKAEHGAKENTLRVFSEETLVYELDTWTSEQLKEACQEACGLVMDGCRHAQVFGARNQVMLSVTGPWPVRQCTTELLTTSPEYSTVKPFLSRTTRKAASRS